MILRQNPFRAAIGGRDGVALVHVLAPHGQLLHLRRDDERADRDASDPGLHGLWHVAGVAAASLLAVIGVFDLIGTLCSGWLTYRYDPRWLLFWYYGLRGLSLLALPS